MGRNFKILISALSLSAIYGIYYFGIPAVIDLPHRTEFIEKTVFEKTGYKISINNPELKMGLLPSIKLSANEFSLLNYDNSKAFEITNPKIKIKLLPLILKKIDIKNFSAHNVDINLVFNKDSQLTLGQYVFEQQNFTINQAVISIDKYNISLDDKLQGKKIVLDGRYLILDDFKNNKHIALSTMADLNAGNKSSFMKADIDLNLPVNKISDNQIKLDGYIKNLDISDFTTYAKALSNNNIKSISGLININTETSITDDKRKEIKTDISLKNFAILKDDLASSIISKDEIKINTDIYTLNNALLINELKLKGENINTFIRGKVTKFDKKFPDLDLKISIFNSKAENILKLIPGEKNLSPDIDLLLLKQTGLWGDVAGNLEIKGKADYPNVFGNIMVSNAYMVKPIPNADKAMIKLGFKGDKFDLDVKVPTSPTQTVWVKGPININKDRTADLHITSTDSVDLKTAQIVLNPLHQILHFELGPVPAMDIKGKGGINLHVMGTRQNPHGWGQFKFKETTASFLDIHNLVLQNGSGTLDFNNQDTLFQTKSALLNSQPVSIKGTCSLLGVLNFDVIANKQNMENIFKTINTSPMLEDIQKMLNPIEKISGNANLKLNLTGQVKDINDAVFNKNIFAKGTVELFSNTIKLKNLPLNTKVSGILNFNNLDTDLKLISDLNNSKINIDGEIKNNIANLKIHSDKFNAGTALKALSSEKIPYLSDLSNINSSFNASYHGKIDNIESNKINIKGKIFSNANSKSLITVDESNFELTNSNLKLPLLKGTFKKSPYKTTLYVSNLFSKNRIVNGNFTINSVDLNLINDKSVQHLLPQDLAKQLNDIEFINGNVNLSTRIKNNHLNAYSILDNINLIYKPKKMKLSIKSGNILLKNNTLSLNKINSHLGQMPLFIDGKIYNIIKNPDFNLYINAKPTQDFFDQFFNFNSVYPIKLKGDAILSSKINGTAKNINSRSTLDIAENSSLYYMGASIGDIENPVKILVDSTISTGKIRINNLQYDKIINSQNNKPFVNTQLNASGTLNILKNNNIGFNNFKIKTLNPTDAKIFNIIFRKPFMKQGIFSSDLVLNGTSLNPKITGKLDITSIDIPFFDSIIRDINLDFKNDKIKIESRGTVLTNDIHLEAIMKNKLVPPYIIENLNLKLFDLNINKITDTLRDIEASKSQTSAYKSSQQQNFDITQLIINNAKIEAKKINVRNINADNFIADLKIDDKMLVSVDKFRFDIAEGSVLGKFKHNLLSRKTDLDIHLNNANALIMSEALFDLKGQVYGSVDGDFNLVCSGSSQENCFKTLSGSGTFKIADGRMPKLGSLEYLLKAGNLFKGGLTGLSINSIIDLITPLKTGNFDSISGDIHIANGIADRINIYSNGNDLNMYMNGSYNIVTSVADMKILGSLSKNITTVFGKIKNASLNTLFNTIPGVNDSTGKLLLQDEISKIPNIKSATDIYRIFAVDINGDINGENFVRSFKWVK